MTHSERTARYAQISLAKWVNWLTKAFAPSSSSLHERMTLVRAVAQGQAVQALIPGLPSDAAAILHRHAPIASLVNDFYVQLHGESRNAHYPREAMEAVLPAVSTRPKVGHNRD